MRFVFILILSSVFLISCASNNQEQAIQEGYEYGLYDPWEGYNRNAFAFNDALDSLIARPVVSGYRSVFPDEVRDGVHNFLITLKSPLTLTNQLLQGDFEGAGNVLRRTTVNVFTGFGGFLDNAGAEGYEYEAEDFGQTLAVWGIGSGPYMIIPFFGPSTVRDAFGIIVETYADPLRIILFNNDLEAVYYGRVALTGIDKRDRVYVALDDMRNNSIDYYAAVRSAYFQHRYALINDNDPSIMQAPEIPDYDDMD
jgi:phospholipid-binding lipoprotein MlaA